MWKLDAPHEPFRITKVCLPSEQLQQNRSKDQADVN